MPYLILIFCLLFVWLAWRRSDWALMLIIAALWSYLIRFSVFGLPTTLLEVMILLSAAIWLIKNYLIILRRVKNKFKKDPRLRLPRYRFSKAGGDKTQRYPFDWEMAALLIIAFIAVGVAGWSNPALGAGKAYFFEPILFFILVFNVLGKDKACQKIIYPLAVGGLIIALVALYQKLTGQLIVPEFWTAEAQRATSLYPYPNAVGLFLGPLILLLVGYTSQLIKEKYFPHRDLIIGGLLLTAVLSFLAIMAAQSDGAVIAVAVSLLLFGLLANRKLAAASLLILVAFGIFLGAQPNLRQKFFDKLTLSDLSGQIRRQQWIETKKMLAADNNQFWGVGLSNYQTAVAPFHSEGIFVNNHDPNFLYNVRIDPAYRQKVWQPTEIYLYPHNIFLNFWSELGLPGLLLFLWIMGKYLVMGFKNSFVKKPQRYLALGLTGAVLVVIIHGLVDVPYFKNDLAILFWLLIALMGLVNLPDKVKVVWVE